MGVCPDRPLITQNTRFDPWKDPLGLIAAYRLARKRRRVFIWLWRGPWPWTTPRARGSTARSRPRAKQTRSSTIYCERPFHRGRLESGARRDPVCGMIVAEAATAPRVTWAGGQCLFCSEACRLRFMENPERFSSAFSSRS